MKMEVISECYQSMEKGYTAALSMAANVEDTFRRTLSSAPQNSDPNQQTVVEGLEAKVT